MRILILEDHAGIRLALEMTLSLEGHEVSAVDRGEKALEWLAAQTLPVDLILMDLNTDGITAHEFRLGLDELYRETPLKRPAVAILSGDDQIEKEAQIFRASFTIRKPFEQATLLESIQNFQPVFS